MKRDFRARHNFALVFACAVLLDATGARAQFNAPKFLKAVATAPKTARAGKPVPVVININIDAPYHIQGNPSKDGYIATELELGSAKGFRLEKVSYPRPIITTVSGERLPVYEGKVCIKADILADRSLKPGKYILPITLKYQGCDEQKCFPPATVLAKTVVTITSGVR